MPPSILLYLSAFSLSVSISAMEIFLGVLLVFLIRWLYKNGVDITKDCPYFVPFFVYWIATIVPFFLGSDRVVIEGNYFDVWPLLYFFVGYYFVRGWNVNGIIFFLITGSAVLGISVFADVEFLGRERGNGFLSIYMTSGNILALGATLAFAILISGYEKRKKLTAYYLFAMFLMLVGIIYTSTRGALIAFSLAASVMLIHRYRFRGAAAAFFLLLALGACSYFSGLGERFMELFIGFDDYRTSHGWRLLLWKETLKLIAQYPIFGIGAGAYGFFMTDIMPSSPLPFMHAHNAYLNQLVLFGFVGFAAFCWFYGKIFLVFFKGFFRNNFAFIGFFTMVVFLVEGVTENNFMDSETRMYHAFLTGVLLGAIRLGVRDKNGNADL